MHTPFTPKSALLFCLPPSLFPEYMCVFGSHIFSSIAAKEVINNKRSGDLMSRPVYIEHLRHPLTLMMDPNAFHIEIYRKTQTLSLGVNGPLI